MIKIINPAQCSGCSACAAGCPKSCISMQRDSEGFLYPVVDEEKCIDCGLCDKACPIISGKNIEVADVASYAAMTKNEQVRENSSSGGVFYELAMAVINEGGIVFGACFDSNLTVVHKGAENEEELKHLLGSKYVQSAVFSVLPTVKAELDRGRKVLFSGTPCQVGGLHSYLRKPYENLISVDLICHGVPSPGLWERYVGCMEKKVGSAAKSVSFRDKITGWRGYSIRIDFENGTSYSKRINEDPYMRAFLNNLSLRPSCHECHFKAEERCSDITLGDFWGIERILPDMNDNKGVSLIIARTDAGNAIVKKICERITVKSVNFEEAISKNGSYVNSAAVHKKRCEFINEIVQGADFCDASKKYTNPGILMKIRRFVKRCLKLIVGK